MKLKLTTYILATLFLLTAKFGQAQVTVDTMTVYPNPFSSVATIHFDIVNNDSVTLTVLNMTGQTIQIYFANTLLPSGSYNIILQGDTLLNGMYFVRLQLGANRIITIRALKLGSVTSIQNVPPAGNIILFPNPATELLNIPIDGQKNIVIVNYNGEICKSVKTSMQTISLADLRAGFYLVSVFDSENKLLTTTKLIKE